MVTIQIYSMNDGFGSDQTIIQNLWLWYKIWNQIYSMNDGYGYVSCKPTGFIVWMMHLVQTTKRMS